RTVGLMFWQQSLGESVDLVLSPRPIHKHHGGMIQDCYSQPPDLYADLCRKIGRPFDLMRYWGPLASRHSSEWIADAVIEVLKSESAPDLLMAYLPHLDYEFQRSGPQSDKSRQALRLTFDLLRKIRAAATASGYELVVFGDYAIAPTTRPPIFLNEQFRRAGLFHTRQVSGRAYPDFATSRAFALADHEIALIYARDEVAEREVRKLLDHTGGICEALDGEGQRILGADCSPDGPDLIVLAEEGSWCAYPWWSDPAEAPDFASHVDIHNKPGYDPCELFWGWPPGRVSRDAGRIRGTHGRAGPGRRVAWFSTLSFDPPPNCLVELAGAVGQWMNGTERPESGVKGQNGHS
ncbi:MAG: alkaline phosphatase family protein, partial [Kiritimatiellia bacterium]|nr:alkaline phosphatase family protein [Kiritimatiellia bacterium]